MAFFSALGTGLKRVFGGGEKTEDSEMARRRRIGLDPGPAAGGGSTVGGGGSAPVDLRNPEARRRAAQERRSATGQAVSRADANAPPAPPDAASAASAANRAARDAAARTRRRGAATALGGLSLPTRPTVPARLVPRTLLGRPGGGGGS